MSNTSGRDGDQSQGAVQKSSIWGYSRLLLALSLLVLLALALLFWRSLEEGDLKLAETRFSHHALHAEQALQHRLHGYEGLMRAAKGMMDGSVEVSAREWAIFIDSIEARTLYPALEGLALVVPVEAEDGAERMRIRLYGPEREVQPGRHSHGLDMDLMQEPELAQAARSARRTGQATMAIFAEPVSTDIDIRGDIFHLMPLYHLDMPLASEEQRLRAFRGWVLGIYHIDDLFDHLLHGSGDAQTVHVELFAEDNATLIYDSRRHAHSPEDEGWLVSDTDFRIADRHWLLRLSSTPEFDGINIQGRLHVLVIAMALALMLWFALLMLITGRRRAEALAESMTLALRESEERYREMFKGNRAVQLLIAAEDGRIVDANDAAEHFYGWSRDELLKMKIGQINTLDSAQVKAEMASAFMEKRNHFNFRHSLADGSVRDVEVHSGPVKVGGRALLYSIVHDTTERRRAEEALRASEAKYRRIIDTTAEGYWLLETASGELLEVNDAICDMLGYRRAELIGRRIHELSDSDGVALLERQLALAGKQEQRSYELKLRHRDGHCIHTRINATDLSDSAGDSSRVFAFITDISEERQAAEKLRQASTFFETTTEAITITDADNKIIAVNPAFTWITGYSAEEVLGKDPSILSSGRQDEAFYKDMWHTLQRLGRWQGEIWNRRKSGESYAEWLSIVAIKDEDEQVVQHMAVFSDITKRKQDEEKIWQQANFDELTGLPNRTLFMDRLGQAMHHAHREGGKAALMFIDLDRFKWVNDTLGHGAGDELLQEVARRLSACVRETDTVARLGGDEFTAILSEVETLPDVEVVAEKILQQLAERFDVQGHEAMISGSIGITVYPRDGQAIEELLRNADAAMYRSKQAGRNTFRYFTQEMNDESDRRMRLEYDIRLALSREELSIHYQPIVDASGRLLGAEALLRWTHAELGAISPDEFIPLAEESGAIIEIEHWVIGQGCKEVVAWSEKLGRDLFVSVNISGLHCKNQQCVDIVDSEMIACDIKPGQLKLEITERMMMEHTEQVVAMFERLRSRGVQLAVDDFGTGYSSLSYLKRFPVDVLKIDRAFVDGLPSDEEDVALVEAIIAMAHSLGLKVVAEGVENAEQQAFLADAGSEMMQGYHFSRPLTQEAFEAYLLNHGAQ